MDFGKLNSINKVNFNLPPDHVNTSAVLKLSGVNKTEVYIGCPKWGVNEWKGKIYPKGSNEKNYLNYYARNFNSIELNATHYNLYPKEKIKEWKEKASRKDFKFCPKFPQLISHDHGLIACEELTDLFYESIAGFEESLGACFLQFPETFGPQNLKLVKNYLETLPAEHTVFVELRHREWFKEPVFSETFQMLSLYKTGAVITDVAGRRDCLHQYLTIPQAFIRFVGNDLHASDYSRIDEWVQRIKAWMGHGLQVLYFFIHQPEETHAPEIAAYMIRQLNRHCALKLGEPIFINGQIQIELF
jgi:uncharacterized protein YecE (DUF72 family)